MFRLLFIMLLRLAWKKLGVLHGSMLSPPMEWLFMNGKEDGPTIRMGWLLHPHMAMPWLLPALIELAAEVVEL